MSQEKQNPDCPRCALGELLEWLRGKIADAEMAVKAREQSAETWRTGTNAEWNAAAAMHPTTAGRTSKKGERTANAERDDKIATKLRRDVEMLNTIAATLSHSNVVMSQPPETPRIP
jgi:hypothetical protein